MSSQSGAVPARDSGVYADRTSPRAVLPAKAVADAMQLAAMVHGDGGPEDVAQLLAKLTRDEFNALTVTLAAMVDVDKTPSELLAWNDGPPRPPADEAEARRLILAVAEFYAITLSDVFGRDKTQRLVRARQVAMWLCVREAQLGVTAVGRIFGRDHTTVLHAVRRVDMLLANGALHRERLVFPMAVAS